MATSAKIQEAPTRECTNHELVKASDVATSAAESAAEAAEAAVANNEFIAQHICDERIANGYATEIGMVEIAIKASKSLKDIEDFVVDNMWLRQGAKRAPRLSRKEQIKLERLMFPEIGEDDIIELPVYVPTPAVRAEVLKALTRIAQGLHERLAVCMRAGGSLTMKSLKMEIIVVNKLIVEELVEDSWHFAAARIEESRRFDVAMRRAAAAINQAGHAVARMLANEATGAKASASCDAVRTAALLSAEMDLLNSFAVSTYEP